jgi:hypothetical protein
MAVNTKNNSMKTAPNGKTPAIKVLKKQYNRLATCTARHEGDFTLKNNINLYIRLFYEGHCN